MGEGETRMQEPARLQRNTDRLSECFPGFGARMRRVLDALETQGFRPRIQDGWRSPEDQLAAFNKGTSRLKFGFHNVTGAGGRKESLACDVLDDDAPLGPSTRYLLALALAARSEGLETGILWELSSARAAAVEAALGSRNIDAAVRVGFDPTHVQPTGLSAEAARNGARPMFGSVVPTVPVPPNGGSIPPQVALEHVVKSGDTLSRIAQLHGLTLSRILELNPQFRPNPNLIRVGDKVRLA